MASPSLESFCCQFNFSTEDTHEKGLDTALTAYNSLCLVSSVIGLVGAIYQLWPRRPSHLPRARKELRSFMRQNGMICWLALADLLAVLGIVLRSALWLGGHLPFGDVQSNDDADFAHIFCAVSLAWIQYFYICTYFWTFCYALDTYFLVNDKPSKPLLYHGLSWGLSAVICGAGLVSLYYPSLLACSTGIYLWPHYLASYVPILGVMIVNPILYLQSSNEVRQGLVRSGRFTDRERNIVSNVKSKFHLIIIVFYVCWAPNIVNGIFIIFRKELSRGVRLALWQYMAVVNPVQSFLNCLVYRGAGGSNCHLRKVLEEEERKHHVQALQSSGSEGENAPLLSYAPARR